MSPVLPGGRPRLLRAALAAADRGWPVFPLFPGSKRPAISGWPQHATTDPVILEIWWAVAPYNIGLACGPARLLVVDLDGPAALDAFTQLTEGADRADDYTYTVATPHGQHRYFTVTADRPGRSTVGRLGCHIDTRGTGGYVLAPGSTRIIGGRLFYYRRTSPSDVAPAPAPQWLIDALSPALPATSPPCPARYPDAYAQAALQGETTRVAGAQPGTRNTVLFAAAVRMGQLAAAGLLDERHITAALMHASNGHLGVDGFTTGEAATAIGNGLRYGRRRPRRTAPHC